MTEHGLLGNIYRRRSM